MRSQFILVAAIGITAIAVGLSDTPQPINHDATGSIQSASLSSSAELQSKPNNEWVISTGNTNADCKFKHSPQLFKHGFKILREGNCVQLEKSLGEFASMKFVNNGDILFYDDSGEKIAEFMQGELSERESIWPIYPFMTLTRID